MSSKSDHHKKGTDIVEMLPSVHKTDVMQAVSDATFNKFLTQDDTRHVAGYVGEGNQSALVKRQLPEDTPHRQAFQLAPVMHSSVGTNEHILTQQGFLQQLSLMGVDTENLDQWARTERFNWIPPINIDMFANYADYFWKPAGSQTPAQYITIENRCNKITSKLRAYQVIIARRGGSLDITNINFRDNAFVIKGKHDDVFVKDFAFVTKNTTNVNLKDKSWVAVTSVYDINQDITTITVSPSISLRQDVVDIINPPAEPTASYVGQWLYKYSSSTTSLSQLYSWSGSQWVVIPQTYPATISLTDQEAIYQAEANCACESDVGGWDNSQWDDSQASAAMWNEDLMANISFGTEAEWIDHNTQTSPGDLWYDLSSDTLKQRNQTNTGWVVVRDEFGQVLAETAGSSRWDSSVGCMPQEHNQWTTNNMWVHKSELSSFVGTKRAQVPILEYSSQMELNEWTETIHRWKYRSEGSSPFVSVDDQPSRLELEPVKAYVADNKDGIWYLYLATDRMSANRDIDYTSVFVPGFRFRIIDRQGSSHLYTAARSVYRQCGVDDPQHTPTGRFCTVVELEEIDFPSAELAGVQYEITAIDPIPLYTRIEPVSTSRGDTWRGYHVHWVLDTVNTSYRAVSAQMANPFAKHSDTQDVSIISLTEGVAYVTETYQEFTPVITGVTQVNLDYRFHFKSSYSSYFAISDEYNIRVYLNGVRQYGTYKELSYSQPGQPDYTIVDGVNLVHSVAPTNFNYVYAIRFDKPLNINDKVRVEVGPASYYDMGMYGVPVRTEEDDAAFIAGIAHKTQPAYKSLVRYHRSEQVKSKINQYPLFNVYDVVSGDVVTTSPLFAFSESASAPVDPATQRRIVATADGKEYTFEQFLVDQDNGIMYAYRTVGDINAEYWYSPLTQTVKKWDGKTWANTIISISKSGMVAFNPVVSIEEPRYLRDQHMSIWVNPKAQVVYQRDADNRVWNALDVTISDADPTLETIWKTSKTTPEYVPEYVDAQRLPIQKGSADGDWEVLSQWRNNPQHENRKHIQYSQLITHLSSIVAGQPRIPGLTNRGIFTLPQRDYNYGVGGTIKEHNDSFDTLISAVNVTEMTPLSVLEFAQDQYLSNGVVIRDTFNRLIVDALIELSGYPVSVIKSRVSERVIEDFRRNEYAVRVYGDTTAYNANSQVGMPNWIATLPILGMAHKSQPHMITDGATVMLRHHDGHRSVVSYTVAEQDRICRILVQMFNKASSGSAVISPSVPATQLLPVYWYTIAGGKPALYKLKSQASREWELVDIVEMLGQVLLDIENRLYAAVPFYPTLVFDYSSVSASSEYEQRMYDRFMHYVVKKQIRAPLVNTTYSLRDPYTWNYANSILSDPPTSKVYAARGCWQALYEYWFGTPYPHLEPWALQGYHEKPLWWDNEYLDTTYARRWKYNHSSKTGMWENIRVGRVPAGYLYPDGTTYSTGNAQADGATIPSYEYFCVNISDDPIAGGYNPDDLLPPYYDNTTIAPIHPTVRSMFNVLSTSVIAPGADYRFGEYGPTEWEWSTSSEHVYDISIAAFLMQPSKFLRQTWGPRTIDIGGLQVDVITKKVYAHHEALFHGDLYDHNKTYIANGMNQWYVNYNRFKGYDTNVGFRDLWTRWKPKQSYQTSGIVDTSTLQIFNKNFDVTDRDYSVVLANTGVVKELWADAFRVSLMTIPPALNQYNNQRDWKFTLDCLAPISRTVTYYGPQLYPVMVDVETNTFTAFAFDIDDVTASVRQFEVRGNQTPFFFEGVKFVVTGSSTNDGTYTVEKAAFDTINLTTRVSVVEQVPTSIRDGRIDIPDFAHNWLTGDMVMMNAAAPLPAPCEETTPYYIIRTGPRTFKLAQRPDYASTGQVLDIVNTGKGDLVVGKVKTSFVAFSGEESPDLWFHYELNKNDVRELRTPEVILGMQNLIDIIDGFVAYQEDLGMRYNHTQDFVEYDSLTGRPTGWQLEIERLIDWAFNLRRNRLQIVDRYEVNVSNTQLNTLRFADQAPAWPLYTKVVFATSGTLPTPLLPNTCYYLVRTDDSQVFKVATTASTANIVDIEDSGSGALTVSLFQRDLAYPQYELNPQRNNMWISTPQGLLSNIVTGPYADIRATQTIYDQYGRFVTPEMIMIYRGDIMNRVTIRPELYNDVELYPAGLEDPNNFLHIGGGHFFVEGYEHIIMFNNYTVGNDLVYDPFLGLYIKRFDLDYFESAQYTLRPNLGGYFLSGNEFKRNIDGSLSDMRRYYDAFDLIEGTDTARHARHLLGYTGVGDSMAYLDLLNVNAKSQFLFYRGMIQSKGSNNAVNAYINSKKFVDAKIDEFWAYKVADFGDSRKKIYPRVKLFADDGRKTDIRFKFLAESDIDYTEAEDINKNFETLSFTNGHRWENFPQQRVDIETPVFLDASLTSKLALYVTHIDETGNWLTHPCVPKTGGHTVDYWYNTPTGIFREFSNGEWHEVDVDIDIRGSVASHNNFFVRVDMNDGVRVLRRRLTSPGHLDGYTTTMLNEVDQAGGYTRINSEIVKFPATAYTFTNVQSLGGHLVFTLEGNVAQGLGVRDRIYVRSASSINGQYYTVDMVESDNTHTYVTVAEDGPIGATTSGTFDHIGYDDVLVIFTVNAGVDRINPARLVDTRSHVLMDNIPLWHPARGIHYPLASHNIDIYNTTDPASYTTSLNVNGSSTNPWLSAEVGTMWLDTNHLSYVPYYDDIIYSDIDHRISKWGNRPAWSDVKVYQWVESLVHPDEWVNASNERSGDATIAREDKITGTPRSTLFKRTRKYDVAEVSDVSLPSMGVLQLPTNTNNSYQNGTVVMVSAVGDATLPKTIEEGMQYVVSMYDSTSGRFTLTDNSGQPVDLTNAPSLKLVQAFDENWIRKDLQHKRSFAALQATFVDSADIFWEPVLTVSGDGWYKGDVVDVYINGSLLVGGIELQDPDANGTFTIPTAGTNYRMVVHDIVDIVRPIPELTDAQIAFNPDLSDDGVTLDHWISVVEYSTTTRVINDINYTYYYFWVSGITTRRRPNDPDCLSAHETANQLASIPTPYMIVQEPHDTAWARGYDVPPYDGVGYDDGLYTAFNGRNQYMPSIFYRKSILSQITSRITEDDRYVVEFTSDSTLRDDLRVNGGYMNAKNKHEKWMMFRREQVGAVPPALWNKMTEALMGCKYNDFTVRVPSFEREHYDELHGTETQYGFGDGQIFVKPEYARATIIHYLQNPDHDFKPVDINNFFERFPATTDEFWNSPQQVKDMCDYMYHTFNTVHTNGIWFDILSDALVTKAKYPGLMKTSWLACHGIRILDVAGMFDD